MKAIKIKFRSLADLENEVLNDLAKSDAPNPDEQGVIYFDNIGSFRKFFTFTKHELIAAISACHPESIYELAKNLGRDFPAVLRDCNILAEMGFIVLQDSNVGRQQKKPKLPFHYSHIEIPELGYKIQVNISAEVA